MEDLIRKRKPLRMTFTKTVDILFDELKKQTPDRKTIKVQCVTLERVFNKMKECDELILNEIKTDPEFEAEYNKIEEYDQKMDLAKAESETYLSNQAVPSEAGGSVTSSPNMKRKLRLPKIELSPFGGDLKDYLGFWSQFQRIHNDSELAAEDKFQYLLQCILHGSRAREVIESFPPTAENYEKAINALKSRFGREDLLIEYYVRELLSLVVKNATEKRGHLTIAKLYDKLESHLRSLESLGLASEKYEAILFPLVESCIPEDLMRVWLRNPLQTYEENDSPGCYGNKLKNLLSFLKREVEGEERLQLARNGFDGARGRWNPKKGQGNEDVIPTASTLVSSDISKRQPSCVFCDKSHESRDCFVAQNWSLNKKKEALSNKKACYVCLKANHRARECKSKLKCVVCSKRHSTIMCFELPVNKMGETATTEQIDSSNVLVAKVSNEVLLQTVLVNIESNGRRKLVRALLDSGSQRSHILKKTVVEMGLKPTGERSLAHSVFGGETTPVKTHGLYKITLKPPNRNFSLDIQVLDQQSICRKIPRLKRGPWDAELFKKNIRIADCGEGSPDIELLIGADFYGQIFTGNVEHLQCGLTAYETHFGWLVMGRVGSQYDDPENTYAAVNISMLTHSEEIGHFWDMEVLGIKDPVEKAPREEEVMKYFNDTLSTDIDGRYMVKLPWIDNADLPDNRTIAEKRLLSTTSKLISSGRYADYDAAFQEWETEKIIEVVPDEEPEKKCHYLPHRGVFKDSSTTRTRPVFDASCKEKGKFSLNDCLDKGLNVLDTIPSILMRFREKKIGVVSDIRKAFLQISINPEDRDFLRFFWWSDYEARKMKTYRHRRLVFGLNCSPFLLGAVINNLLLSCPREYHDVAEVLREGFYVDNCVTSVDTDEELSQFVTGATELMKLGQFDLRGWESSSSEFESKPCPVLGLLWDRKEDVLFCDPEESVSCDTFTRRNVLSSLQKVFDPIGFSCPVTIVPKVLLQETWRKKLGWDERLPAEAEKKFIKWLSDLSKLKDIRIPRCVIPLGYRESFSLHTFCDASTSSYACVVYLRAEGKNGVNVQLLQAKSRVAPLRNTTINRLELLSCCIGARLAHSMLRAMKLEDVSRFFWSDSTTVLHWIKNNENWGTFVNNRVKEIAQLSSREMWRHVPGRSNPADLPSRGCSVQTLKESKWWEGPQWLKESEESWPNSKEVTNEDEVSKEREKPLVAINLSTHETAWYLRKFSKYSTIVRLVAWILRFGTNCRNPANRIEGELSVNEIYSAEQKLLGIVQRDNFSDTSMSNKLKSLNAFHDADGLIRVKTKIFRRDDEENFKCPIVLPCDHPLVEQLIYERHLISCHGGTQVVLTDLRQKFWILRGRKTVQRILKRCIRCKRYTSKKLETMPAPLPEERVRDALVFEVTGVDLAGPLHLKKGDKTWILLFTCAVYRAVHLELIQSLSTDGFLLGLRRFIARRGRPRKIYSDNGTNFVGTVNQMNSLDWNKILKESSILRIQWVFSPPTAAWWGGFWERMVQMVKKILRRVLGRASINFEELNTILCDAEAVINSRPLNYLSEDPEDLTPLTPAMFLQDIQTVGVPDLDNLDSVNLSKRYRYQQNLREDIRKRFREEYLSMLVHQQASRGKIKQVQIGDVVLIECDKKRLDWPMGRVVEVFPGKDNTVRVVRVKTVSGELLRPVQRLYPLELDCHNEIFDTEPFKHVKTNHIKSRNKCDDREGETVFDKNLDDKQCTEAVKTKCGRTVKKPARYS